MELEIRTNGTSARKHTIHVHMYIYIYAHIQIDGILLPMSASRAQIFVFKYYYPMKGIRADSRVGAGKYKMNVKQKIGTAHIKNDGISKGTQEFI